MLVGVEFSIILTSASVKSLVGPRKGRKSLIVNVTNGANTPALFELSALPSLSSTRGIFFPVAASYPAILTYDVYGSWLEQEIFIRSAGSSDATVIEVYEQ